MVVELEHKMQGLPNEWDGPDTDQLKSIQGKFLEIPCEFFSDPISVSEAQEIVHTIVVVYLQKIQNIPNSESRDYCKKVVAPLSNLQLIQFPTELSIETFLFLPIEDLLRMRLVCKYYKEFIDNNRELQTKIAHHYLQKMQPKANIPPDDLKMDMTHHKLSVEVNGNLNLWKFRNELKKAIPWISHLIIQDGKANELTELFGQLQQSKRLVILYLVNCEVDSKAIGALQSLITPNDRDPNPLFVYLCNLKPVACELPSQFSTSSSNVVIIDSNKANEYSIERFLTQESNLIDLKELDTQVQNESSSGEFILKKMKAMNPIIKAGIVSSIWHSVLTPTTEASTPISKSVIQRKVLDFVSDQPHHPAVRAAVKKNLEKYLN